MEIVLNNVENEVAVYEMNGTEYQRKIRTNKSYPYFVHEGLECIINNDNTISINEKLFQDKSFKPSQLQMMKPVQSEFDINERFEFLENFTDMVIEDITPSLLVTGSGGLGKSHTVKKQLLTNNLVEDEDYVFIKGFATPKALYATLYENANKIIIFDDCDSVLKDPTALNILKGALEINKDEPRIISWLSKGFIDDGLPNSFQFEGQIIFISNLHISKVDQAITSRAIPVDLSMTTKDKLDRMQNIIADILPEYDVNLKQEVLDFMTLHADEAKDLNMRTLQKCCHVKFKYQDDPKWENAAKYLLVN